MNLKTFSTKCFPSFSAIIETTQSFFWNIHVTKSKLKVFSWCISSLRMQTRHYNSYRDRKICEMKTQNIGPRVRAAGWNISRLNNLILLRIVYFILLADERDELIYPGFIILHYMCACVSCLSISIIFIHFYPYIAIHFSSNICTYTIHTQLKPRTTPETGKDISRDRFP